MHDVATRQPENSKRAHFRSLALQTPPKFHESTPEREKKERKLWREREKKSAKFWAPTLRAPTPRPLSKDPPCHPPDPPTFRAPLFLGLGLDPLGPHSSGPHPLGPHPVWSQNSTSKNWPKSKLAKVEIGRSRIGQSRSRSWKNGGLWDGNCDNRNSGSDIVTMADSDLHGWSTSYRMLTYRIPKLGGCGTGLTIVCARQARHSLDHCGRVSSFNNAFFGGMRRTRVDCDRAQHSMRVEETRMCDAMWAWGNGGRVISMSQTQQTANNCFKRSQGICA